MLCISDLIYQYSLLLWTGTLTWSISSAGPHLPASVLNTDAFTMLPFLLSLSLELCSPHYMLHTVLI